MIVGSRARKFARHLGDILDVLEAHLKLAQVGAATFGQASRLRSSPNSEAVGVAWVAALESNERFKGVGRLNLRATLKERKVGEEPGLRLAARKSAAS